MCNSKVELLSPARNAEIGITAINCGADAVYIGAPHFGARAAATNSLADIERLTSYAHRFDCKVLITLNTILRDDELDDANRMAWQLYNIGADALIIQDFGLLETDLPPIRLHASTQCNNATVEHIKWLEQIGFSRVVLARELSLDQIKQIRQNTSVELEAFIHGALCVSYSGQCYLSQALRGRSANRGECAQMCRLPYDLLDADGNTIIRQKHLLSLKDMDRSEYLQQLIDAGVTTFKIEGRLKDEDYVKNIVTYYRHLLDHTTPTDFTPYPAKTFHRSQTDYFLNGRTRPMANIDSPKSTGEEIGKIVRLDTSSITLDTAVNLHQGDGLCIGSEGFTISQIEDKNDRTIVFWNKQHSNININNLHTGQVVSRNFDSTFSDRLAHFAPKRKRPISITLTETNDGFSVVAQTTHDISVTLCFEQAKEPANNQARAMQTIHSQLSKMGDTIFELRDINIDLSQAYFLPISTLNEWRRQAVAQLEQACLDNYKRQPQQPITHAPYYSTLPLDYHANIFNQKAKHFCEQCGAKIEGMAFEQSPQYDAELMRCRYCIKYEMGWCRNKQQPAQTPKEPLYLQQANQKLRLHFDCRNCQMKIFTTN